jgi:hypothetical protein
VRPLARHPPHATCSMRSPRSWCDAQIMSLERAEGHGDCYRKCSFR